MKAGGSVHPASHETIDNKEHYIYQEGQAVFKAAVSRMADVSAEMMERHQLTADDLAWLVPHQANLRIIDATGKTHGARSIQSHDQYSNIMAIPPAATLSVVFMGMGATSEKKVITLYWQHLALVLHGDRYY